jgi:hypothetical protein
MWDLDPDYDALLADWRLKHLGEFDGDKVAIAGQAVSGSELPAFRVAHATWSEARAFHGWASALASAGFDLVRYAVQTFRGTARWPFPNVGAVHLGLTTQDDMIVAARRSDSQAFYPGSWSCGIEEGLEWSDFTPRGGAVHHAARRGLREELGLPSDAIEPRSLELVALVAELPSLYPCWIAIARLALSSHELNTAFREYKGHNRSGASELDTILFLDPAREELRKLVRVGQGADAYLHPFGSLHPTFVYRLNRVAWNDMM